MSAAQTYYSAMQEALDEFAQNIKNNPHYSNSRAPESFSWKNRTALPTLLEALAQRNLEPYVALGIYDKHYPDMKYVYAIGNAEAQEKAASELRESSEPFGLRGYRLKQHQQLNKINFTVGSTNTAGFIESARLVPPRRFGIVPASLVQLVLVPTTRNL